MEVSPKKLDRVFHYGAKKSAAAECAGPAEHGKAREKGKAIASFAIPSYLIGSGGTAFWQAF